MIGKVLRMHHRDNKSMRVIAKATSLSRNTVRKYLRAGSAEAPKYSQISYPHQACPLRRTSHSDADRRCISAEERAPNGMRTAR